MNRKIRNLLGTIVLIISVFQVTSCSLEPKYAEDDDVKTFVLTDLYLLADHISVIRRNVYFCS